MENEKAISTYSLALHHTDGKHKTNCFLLWNGPDFNSLDCFGVTSNVKSLLLTRIFQAKVLIIKFLTLGHNNRSVTRFELQFYQDRHKN